MLAVSLLALAFGLVPVIPAAAGPSPQRTVRVRIANTGDPNGASGQPSVSTDARYVAFTSKATDLSRPDGNRTVRDIFLYDQGTGAIRMLSRGLGGKAADGPSFDPVVDASGKVTAFTSKAENLVEGDANGVPDIFVAGFGLVARVSVAPDGAEANGPSREPDLSADGSRVVFTSDADNLVAGDTNGRADVFVRDLATGVTSLVSSAPQGAAARGTARAPAISPDGGFVSFTSSAPNLVRTDRNGVSDVFVADLSAAKTRLVSVGRRGRRQNASVARPFHQVSDISRNGRRVVFDSDATNLVSGDRNRRTDVFVRDLVRARTRRVSLAVTNQEGRGDSFTPRITPDGRWVAFISAADNLVPGDAIGQDVFLRDLRRETTTVVDVASDGRRRGRERTRQVLDRPALADDATTVAFMSSAANLIAQDDNGVSDVFLRRLEPPASAFVGSIGRGPGGGVVVEFASRDRFPGPLRCRLDDRRPTLCPLDGLLLPPLASGRHVLVALAGSPGSFYARKPIVIRLRQANGRLTARVGSSGR